MASKEDQRAELLRDNTLSKLSYFPSFTVVKVVKYSVFRLKLMLLEGIKEDGFI